MKHIVYSNTDKEWVYFKHCFYYVFNFEKIKNYVKNYGRIYRQKNKVRLLECKRQYRKRKPHLRKEERKRYVLKYREKIKKYNSYYKHKFKDELRLYRLLKRLSNSNEF